MENYDMNERTKGQILRDQFAAMRDWQDRRDTERKPYTGTREERRTLHNACQARRAREKRKEAREKLKRILDRVKR